MFFSKLRFSTLSVVFIVRTHKTNGQINYWLSVSSSMCHLVKCKKNTKRGKWSTWSSNCTSTRAIWNVWFVAKHSNTDHSQPDIDIIPSKRSDVCNLFSRLHSSYKKFNKRIVFRYCACLSTLVQPILSKLFNNTIFYFLS